MPKLIESVATLSAKQRKALAVLLKQQGVDLYSVAPVFRRDPTEPLSLSFAQERQLFLWHLEPDSAAYHLPTALNLRGALDLAALQQSFDALVAQGRKVWCVFDNTAAGEAVPNALDVWRACRDGKPLSG